MLDVSVIIPFHNIEGSIERVVRSMALQSFEKIEYIFVNDGSTDRSVEVLRDFLALNPSFEKKVKFLSLEFRKGSAEALKVGIENAEGEYIIKCDADDYIDPTAFGMMYKEAGEGVYDVVIAPYYEHKGKRIKIVVPVRHIDSLNDMSLNTVHFSLCNKLLRRSLLEEKEILPYPGVDCWGDLGVVSRFMAFKPKVKVIDTPFYHYIIDPGKKSLSRDRKTRVLEDHLTMALLLEKWFNDNRFATENEEFLNHLKFLAKVKFLRGRDKEVGKWKCTFPETNAVIMSLRHIPLYYRVIFRIVYLLPTKLCQWMADKCDVFYRKRPE